MPHARLAERGNVVAEFIKFVTRPVIGALSAEYQRGNRLDQVIEDTIDAFSTELKQDGDPRGALMRLSEDDAVRIINIHKCKGLEFEKVVVVGVEHELFWSDRIEDNRAEFFVAISRAKHELVLTWTQRRARPVGASGIWDIDRHPQEEFLSYAVE
jgi:superfamily I DNA/RNA helicase